MDRTGSDSVSVGFPDSVSASAGISPPFLSLCHCHSASLSFPPGLPSFPASSAPSIPSPRGARGHHLSPRCQRDGAGSAAPGGRQGPAVTRDAPGGGWNPGEGTASIPTRGSAASNPISAPEIITAATNARLFQPLRGGRRGRRGRGGRGSQRLPHPKQTCRAHWASEEEAGAGRHPRAHGAPGKEPSRNRGQKLPELD